jgi:hypothetical protein
MQTRERARGVVTGAQGSRTGALAGFGHTAVVVASALIASVLLIAAVAAVSMCWEIHPLLTVGVVIVLGWALSRLASLVLTSGRRAAR